MSMSMTMTMTMGRGRSRNLSGAGAGTENFKNGRLRQPCCKVYTGVLIPIGMHYDQQ